MINLKWWLCSVLIILVGLNISTFLKLRSIQSKANKLQFSQENTTSKFKTSNKNTVIRNALETQSELQPLSERTPLISSTAEDTITLETLVGSSPKLVFHYSELNCMQCVDQEVGKIKKLAQKIGRENILIVATYDNIRDLFLFKRVNNLELPVYKLPDEGIGLPLEKANVPFLFIIDEEFKSKLVFVPEKTLPAMSEKYYGIIKSRFFKSESIQ